MSSIPIKKRKYLESSDKSTPNEKEPEKLTPKLYKYRSRFEKWLEGMRQNDIIINFITEIMSQLEASDENDFKGILCVLRRNEKTVAYTSEGPKFKFIFEQVEQYLNNKDYCSENFQKTLKEFSNGKDNRIPTIICSIISHFQRCIRSNDSIKIVFEENGIPAIRKDYNHTALAGNRHFNDVLSKILKSYDNGKYVSILITKNKDTYNILYHEFNEKLGQFLTRTS
jgi:hypothetical protein